MNRASLAKKSESVTIRSFSVISPKTAGDRGTIIARSFSVTKAKSVSTRSRINTCLSSIPYGPEKRCGYDYRTS